MFENLNTALTPELQPSCPFPRLSRPAAPSSGAPGFRAGSSQHLRSLGKAAGAQVNDFLRRKEAWSLSGVGTMEVNKTAGALLAGGADLGDER